MADKRFVFQSVPTQATTDLEKALEGLAEPYRNELLTEFNGLEAAIISKDPSVKKGELSSILAHYFSHTTLGVIKRLQAVSNMDNLGYHDDNYGDHYHPHVMGFVVPNFIRIAKGEVLDGKYQDPKNAFFGVMAAAGHDFGFGVNDGNRTTVQQYDQNEPLGAAMVQVYMDKFALKFGFTNEQISNVVRSIEYTWISKPLASDNKEGIITGDVFQNASVLRDADLSYAGYRDKNESIPLANRTLLAQRKFFDVEHESLLVLRLDGFLGRN